MLINSLWTIKHQMPIKEHSTKAAKIMTIKKAIAIQAGIIPEKRS